MIPFCLMFISSSITFFGVLKAHKRMKSMTNMPRSMSRTRRDIKFGITMISMNLVFLFLVAPLNLADEFKLFLIKDIYKYVIFNTVVVLLFDSYFSLVFFFQLIVNSIIREEFYKIVKLAFSFILKQLFY